MSNSSAVSTVTVTTAANRSARRRGRDSVSYTHLTLPTSALV